MMTEQKRAEDTAKDQDQTMDNLNDSGDPGRTPDKAEGDEQTVDESLREKEARA